MYLNDDDMESTFKQIESVAEEKAIVCIREPIGLTDRLTLKEQFSDELKDKLIKALAAKTQKTVELTVTVDGGIFKQYFDS